MPRALRAYATTLARGGCAPGPSLPSVLPSSAHARRHSGPCGRGHRARRLQFPLQTTCHSESRRHVVALRLRPEPVGTPPIAVHSSFTRRPADGSADCDKISKPMNRFPSVHFSSRTSFRLGSEPSTGLWVAPASIGSRSSAEPGTFDGAGVRPDPGLHRIADGQRQLKRLKSKLPVARGRSMP